MLARPDTPGVYVEPVDASRGRVTAFRTDIAGFVGIAERGPIGVAVACRSMRQFESIFGGYSGSGYLAYAVRGFFENGGALCRVVRVAAVEAAAASGRIRLADGRFGLVLSASSAGSWGNRLAARITPSRRAETMAGAGGNARRSPVIVAEGFAPGALARISQGAAVIWRIVADVDPAANLLHWTHPDPQRRRSWEEPLAGIDIGTPFRIERIDYDVAISEQARLVAAHAALSPVEGQERFAPDILRLPAALMGPVFDERLDSDRPISPLPIVAAIADGLAPDWAGVPILDAAGGTLTPAGGVDGLTLLSPDDFMQRGLAPLERTPEVAILACPDILVQPVRTRRDPLPLRLIDPCGPCTVPEVAALPAIPAEPELPPVFDAAAIFRVQAAMIEQCERLRDRVALIDPPFAAARDDRIGSGPVQAWRSRFDSAFGALYHPWLAVPDPLARGGTRLVPPSGHVAGQFARADRSVGVHRAAADAPLAWTQAVSMHVDKARHGLLNSLGINVIAGREGRLLRILGARTMASDPSWRFVPVRRLVCMLRDALDAATQWAVFEPNNDATRLLLQDNISGFLRQLWLRGAFAGASPEEAYRVRCDEENNDPARRANGELRIDIAIAPAAPLEFIVLRIGRQGNSFELVEDGAFASAMIGGAH